MKSRILWALVALNVFLLVVLVARSTTPNYAMAQAARPSPIRACAHPRDRPWCRAACRA